MGLSLNCIEFIFDKKFVKNKNILFIGDHRISFDKFSSYHIKKFNLDESINQDLRKSKINGVEQKKFLKKLFQNFGYKDLYYLENFSSENIDFRINLSEENATKNISKKFGIVIDNSTSIYASNIINGLKNIFELIDLNGFLKTGLDPMSFNRFPMQTSPETLLDILVCHGFDPEIFIEEIFRKKKSIKRKYKLNYFEKHNLITNHLNFNQFFFHIIFLLKNYFFSKKNKNRNIYASDYIKLKKENFKGLRNTIQVKKIRDHTKQNTFNWKNNFFFRFIKDLINRLSLFIETRGRVVITFEAKKLDIDHNFKQNSSTIYYSLLNDN